MGLRAFLKRATHIPHSGRGILGNLIKNVSPFLAFTPVGTLGAGLAGFAGGRIRGESTGQALRSGISNAGIGAGARGLARHAGLFGGTGGGATPTATAGGGDVAATPINAVDTAPTSVTGGSVPMPGMTPLQPGVGGVPTSVLTPGAAPPSTPSFLSRAAGATGRFIEHNPTATALGLQSLGNLTTAGTENRMNEAQARLLESQVTETADQRRRREAQDRFFSNGQLSLAPMDVRPSPYA